MKAALGIDDSQSQLANNRGTRSKKLTENFRFLSVISPIQELNVYSVFHVLVAAFSMTPTVFGKQGLVSLTLSLGNRGGL